MGSETDTAFEAEERGRLAKWIEARRRRAPARCPSCGSPGVVPLILDTRRRGWPEAVRRGEVALGGCMVGYPGGDPEWACAECGHGWRDEPQEETFGKHSITIEGKRYRLVRYGEEVDEEGRDFFSTRCHICGARPGALHARNCPMGAGRPHRRPPRCLDCGTTVGEIHRLGCGIESCPRCHGQ